jgi:hypothetical protein
MILEHGEEDGLKRKKHGGRLKIKPYVLLLLVIFIQF